MGADRFSFPSPPWWSLGHGELRTPSELSAPPCLQPRASLHPSISKHRRPPPRELLFPGEPLRGCRRFLALGKIPEKPKPSWEKGA